MSGEPDDAFEAFTVYLDLGITRTVSALTVKTGMPVGKLEGFAQRWKWELRSATWDDEQVRRDALYVEEQRRLSVKQNVLKAKVLSNKYVEGLNNLDAQKLGLGELLHLGEVAARAQREAVLGSQMTDDGIASDVADAVGDLGA